MSNLLLDSRTIGFVVSLLYVLLPLGAWFILRRQDDPGRLGIWVSGNIAVGLFISLAAFIWLLHSVGFISFRRAQLQCGSIIPAIHIVRRSHWHMAPD